MTTYSPRRVEPRAFRRWAKQAAWLLLNRPIYTVAAASAISITSLVLHRMLAAATGSGPSPLLSTGSAALAAYGLLVLFGAATVELTLRADPDAPQSHRGALFVRTVAARLFLGSIWFVVPFLGLTLSEMHALGDSDLLSKTFERPRVAAIIVILGLCTGPFSIWRAFARSSLGRAADDQRLISIGLAMNPAINRGLQCIFFAAPIPTVLILGVVSPTVGSIALGPSLLFAILWFYCGYCDIYEHRTPKPRLAPARSAAQLVGASR